ncbi:MAG: Ppx/GppA family phosphatase [Novosphingobium sp.]
MAEQDPPAAKVDVPGRARRRRKGRKGRPRPPAAGIAKGKARPVAGGKPGKTDAAPRECNDTGLPVANSPEPASRDIQRQALPRQSYAAIDLGTNNCRLLIARPSGENFTVIDAFSRVVRLGEGLARSGRLSLDIISAREEARLAVLGCHVLLEEGIGPAMIFDIGGGSTELVLIESTGTVPRILDWQSVPWGVVSLTESCGQEGSTRAEREERYRHMHGLVSESFANFARRVSAVRENAGQAGPLRLLGPSGTGTTLASLHLELPQYDRRMVDGLIVPAESMREISGRLSSMAVEERRELNCIGNERADLVVAGCAILESILDLWPAARLGVADRGIREGILRSLIASHGYGRGGQVRTVNDSVRCAVASR